MIFGKKRGMIDVRELQRRGVVVIPKEEIVIPTDKDGFVELGSNSKVKTQKTERNTSTNSSFFGFTSPAITEESPSPSNFSIQSDGYNKREVDTKLSELDNKIYKLEQRIELLEKKVGVNQSGSSNGGLIGW
jgi:hypothetical protein